MKEHLKDIVSNQLPKVIMDMIWKTNIENMQNFYPQVNPFVI